MNGSPWAFFQLHQIAVGKTRGIFTMASGHYVPKVRNAGHLPINMQHLRFEKCRAVGQKDRVEFKARPANWFYGLRNVITHSEAGASIAFEKMTDNLSIGCWESGDRFDTERRLMGLFGVVFQ
jgi:hypothetical protein